MDKPWLELSVDERIVAYQTERAKGGDTADIAQRLGIPLGTLASFTHRAGLTEKKLGTGRLRADMDILAAEDNGCSWPIGEPGKKDFGFCGKPNVRGKSYCEDHYKQSRLKIDTVQNKPTA